MQSRIIALLSPEGGPEATMLMRLANGQFAMARIDARMASAARLAANYEVDAAKDVALEVGPAPIWKCRARSR